MKKKFLENFWDIYDDMKLLEILNEISDEVLNKPISGVYRVYRGYHKELDLSDINFGKFNKNIWFSQTIEYAKLWGEHVYQIDLKLDNLLDVYSDIGKKTLTLKQIIKYLKSKNVYTRDIEYYLHETMLQSPQEKYLFWELVSDHKTITYPSVANDIFTSGYDSISIFEYGYSYRQKDRTFLVKDPKSKIININKV